jgi:hypothetical protein
MYLFTAPLMLPAVVATVISRNLSDPHSIIGTTPAFMNDHVPAVVDVGSSLTILTHNDLYNTGTSRNVGAILLDQAVTNKDAQQACLLLHENLWSSSTQSFMSSLKDSLTYQVYLKNFPPDQLFWVASSKEGMDAMCQAINVDGVVKQVKCQQRLPTVCTQSAPISNMNNKDNSRRYRVAQHVGSASLVGYRDFYAWQFRGVRYAQKPQRFAYSSPFVLTGSKTAVSNSFDCLQRDSTGALLGQEDCLFLNLVCIRHM